MVTADISESSGLTVLQFILFLYKYLYMWEHYLAADEDLWSIGFALNSNKHVYSSKGKVKSRLSVHRGMGEFPGVSREF